MAATTGMRAARWRRSAVGVLLLTVVAGCGGSGKHSAAPSPTPGPGTVTLTLHDRPFALHVPPSYDPATPAPLLVLLHAYSSTGLQQESYVRFTPESDRLGFLYAYPDGRTDPRGNRFWNATDACCDLYDAGVDDSGYLSDVIKRIESSYRVDARRVYLVGHSNGAFMSFRMACEHADQITAIATLNGAMWQDASRCRPSTAVSVLDIRATADETIKYAGGDIRGVPYPSAARGDADWVELDHCTGTPTAAPAIDLIPALPGAETGVQRYATCASGSTVETWTIDGAGHVPAFGDTFAPAVARFLLARAKP